MDNRGADRYNWLVFIPVAANILYYLFPAKETSLFLLFTPQLLSYSLITSWLWINGRTGVRISWHNYKEPFRYGVIAGLFTGITNLFFIIKISGWLGQSYEFLRETPHAKIPSFLMMPLGIILVSAFVEINFRGFILNKLLAVFGNGKKGAYLAIALSAIVFSYDPFMLHYFKLYHWLALFDGIIWGYLFYRTGSILGPIAAHSICVIIVYTILITFYR